MQIPNTTPLPLAEYVDLIALQKLGGIPKAFPSVHSLNWFVRHRREELISSGAMIMVARRYLFHPERFQQVAVEIGRTMASARSTSETKGGA